MGTALAFAVAPMAGASGGDTDCDPQTWFPDRDGDGFGWAEEAIQRCGAVPGHVEADKGRDCDDDSPRAYPGATEVCDGIDNDCDGVVDGEAAVDRVRYGLDLDGDRIGLCAVTVEVCPGVAPEDYVRITPETCDPGGDPTIGIGPTPPCGCRTAPPAAWAWVGLLGLALTRRQRR